MKSLKNHLKLIALILCVSILIQSCTVYKSANVSLEDASKTDLKVKITKTNGKKETFKKIALFDNGEFYGQKHNKSNDANGYVLIDKEQVQKVQLYDKKTP